MRILFAAAASWLLVYGIYIGVAGLVANETPTRISGDDASPMAWVAERPMRSLGGAGGPGQLCMTNMAIANGSSGIAIPTVCSVGVTTAGAGGSGRR